MTDEEPAATAEPTPPTPPKHWNVDVQLVGGRRSFVVAAWSYDPAAGLSIVTTDGTSVYVPIRAITLVEATPYYEETP